MNNKLRDLFQQPFDLVTYRSVILSQLLHAQRLLTSPEMLEQYDNGDQLYGLGYLTDNEGKEIGLYYTHVPNGDVRRKRVGFRKMLHPYVKYGVDAAIAVFDDGEYWRLSYICDLKGGVTSAKRFSYVFGDPKGQYNTPVGRLTDLAKKRLTLDDLHKTFSVDALSQEFFDEYHRHYDRIIAELSRQGTTGAVFHDYVKKMMGRIVFLHFLQKKRWLNDDPEFLSKLFFLSPYKQDFLDQELEPLFFGIFNTEPDKRERLFHQEHWDLRWLAEWEKLPYLNGGLFERDEVDKMKIKLPASLFEQLFKFMASYNFTIDENDPDDADIGIDPEMLGKIFESLLEDNKAKGAFYTPKEIVRYMCKESLIAYLETKVSDNASEMLDTKQSIRTFVEHHELPEELEPYREVLDTALRDVKICDPAIGSGAFPMGLLNELWRCREAIEIVPDELDLAYRAELKKEIIENNIYGVDIERGAIDIARLRFWLSIVVDAEKPEPLPNFDYKFMQGNSLVESYKGFDLSRISNRLPGGQSKSTQLLLGLDSEFSKKNLQRLMRDYFSVTDHKQKDSMRQAINDAVKQLITDFIGVTNDELKSLNPSANKDFFLWHTWFKDIFDNGGFDIVIGNPPYKIVEKEDKYKPFYDTHYIVAHGGKRNLYHLFFERGITITKNKGVLSYITPDTYFSGNDTLHLRKYLVEHSTIQNIVHYTEKDKVFENVTQAVAVIILYKQKGTCSFSILEHGSISTINYNNLTNDNKYIFKSSNRAIERICMCKCTFGDVANGYKGDVNLGIKKGYFRKTKETNSLPLVRGIQISKFLYEPGDEYCLIDALSKNQTALHRVIFQEVANMGLIQRVKGTIIKDVICGDSCNIIYPKSDDIDIKYLLGILNSSTVNYYFKFYNQTNHVPIGEIKNIPFPKVTKIKQEPIISVVEKILNIKKSIPNADTSALEHQIDELVYQLYNLTPEEIAIIEQNN